MITIERAVLWVVVVLLLHPIAASAQARGNASAPSQTPATWDQMVVEISRLQASGSDAELTAALERYVKTDPKRWEPYVALAQALERQGKFAAAADALRKGRKAAPEMPATFALELIQYDVQQVTESPALPRAEAARALAEASAVADQLIAAKQEVRMAMLAKSLALKTQAERVEQTDARRRALMQESDRLSSEALFTNADGSRIPKTAHDEWLELQGGVFVGDAAAGPSGAAIEKFIATHPDFAPAHTALGTYYQGLGDAIKERTPAATAARTKHFQAADAQLKRAAALATDPMDIARALDGQIALLSADRLNRPAEAEALVRAALARYPDQPMFLNSLASVLVPASTVPTDAAVRALREAATTPETRTFLGMFLWHAVSSNKTLPRDTAAKLLTEATTALDGVLKALPNNIEAITYKSVVLRLRAERVEQDPARIKSLQAEADKLAEQAKKLRSVG